MGKGARGVRWLKRLVQYVRQARTERGVRVTGIARDLVHLNLTHQLGVRAYFQYRLFAPGLTTRQKLEYLPDSKWATERLWALLNPVPYRVFFRNKLAFNQTFGAKGLPVTRVRAVYDPQTGHTLDGRPLRTPGELREWLQEYDGDGLVFKALWGREGFQVLVLGSRAADDPGTFLTLAGEPYDADRLVEFARNTTELERIGADQPQSYLLEERVRPHPALEELIGPTLCCVRIVTVIGLDGRPSILGAVYKLQPAPLGVDHLSYGALGSWVDLESGALGPGRSRHGLGYSSVIPGTDRNFVGFQLPHWDQVKQVALAAAEVIPEARAIGWDIAISAPGPVLIEGNADWSTSLLQIPAPHGLMTGEFRTLCDTLAAGQKTRPFSRGRGTTS
jgi:hypothetical protein